MESARLLRKDAVMPKTMTKQARSEHRPVENIGNDERDDDQDGDRHFGPFNLSLKK